MHRKNINLQMRTINRCFNRSNSIIPIYMAICILNLKYIATTSVHAKYINIHIMTCTFGYTIHRLNLVPGVN